MGSQSDVNYQLVGAGLVLSAHSNNYAEVDIGFLVEGSQVEGIVDG